ncbi:MAG: ACP S-malonyltransferase [Aestuariibacter sp.]
MKTFMFPGQGSQAKGMGGELFDEFPDLVAKADKVLGYSIKELCLEDKNKQLGQTQFTQPALYTVNALSYYKAIQEGEKPDFLAGHSLGEFNALLAAECFKFESGLKLVKKRGELMSEATGGGMAAIINASEQQIRDLIQEHKLENIDLANFNTPSQIVISGMKDEISSAQGIFQEHNMLFIPLNTSGAFHSRFMEDAKMKFANYLKKFKFSEPSIPVIANVTAAPYAQGQIPTTLADQIVHSVRWSDTIAMLMDKGDMEFVEIGHGDVLTKMVQKINRELKKAKKTVEKTTAAPDKQVSPVKTEKTASAYKSQSQAEISKSETTIKAEQLVAEWNKKHPVGTKVKSSFDDYPDMTTRTEAMVLFGHRAAVYLQDYNGYFSLDELTAL